MLPTTKEELLALLQYADEETINDRNIVKALACIKENEESNKFDTFSIEIIGEPAAWNRAVKTKTHFYDPNVGHKAYIANAVQNHFDKMGEPNFALIAGEVELEAKVYRSIPKGMPAYRKILAEARYIRPTAKPDFDNYAKNICDTLNSILYNDDCQVVMGRVEKFYSFKPRYVLTFTYRNREIK